MKKEKNSSLRLFGKFFLALFLAVALFASGVFVGRNSSLARAYPVAFFNSTQPENVDFSTLWTIWHILDEKFVPAAQSEDGSGDKKKENKKDAEEPSEERKRVWGMAQGLAASLGDPYTVFMPPQESKMFSEDMSGEFEGVGMEVAIKEGILTVVSPLKGTPAFKAGIKAGDKIVEIDGESTENMNINEAVRKIRGKKGTEVELKILRDSEPEPLVIKVVRDKIEIPTIKTEKRADGIFVIELMTFTEKAPLLFRDALVEFINSRYDKLIIDLRGNPGGYLDAAVDIASWFLPKGATVVTEDFAQKRDPIVHRSKGYNIFTDDLKLIILMDKGSASASEILAGALRAHGKATLVGTNSFGKGSVQELIDLDEGTSLKVTVARWRLPDDSWIGGEGIKPDIEVEFPDKEELLCSAQKRKEFEESDYIMERAVNYLHSLK